MEDLNSLGEGGGDVGDTIELCEDEVGWRWRGLGRCGLTSLTPNRDGDSGRCVELSAIVVRWLLVLPASEEARTGDPR
jgi:hypothetical protein